jgi:hypothetical protein
MSLDQMMVNSWKGQSSPLPCLTTAVYASATEPHPKMGFGNRSSFSYLGPGGPLNLPIIDPLTAFDTVFPPPLNGPAAGFRRRLLERQSVFDVVANDLTSLSSRLGSDDRDKLQVHLSAVRDLELQLSNLLNGPNGACPSAPSVASSPWFQPGASGSPVEVNVETYNDQMIQFMASLMAAAIKCNVTRVASLQFGYARPQWSWGWLGINEVVPPDTIDTMGVGGPATTSNYVTWQGQYYARTVAKVALALKNTPEGGGTMLDNTLIVWATDMGRSDGAMQDIPLVLIGLVGNGVKAGGRVIDYSVLNGRQTDLTVWGYQALNALGASALVPMSPWNVPMNAYAGF